MVRALPIGYLGVPALLPSLTCRVRFQYATLTALDGTEHVFKILAKVSADLVLYRLTPTWRRHSQAVSIKITGH
jgi:hypothetical protein